LKEFNFESLYFRRRLSYSKKITTTTIFSTSSGNKLQRKQIE